MVFSKFNSPAVKVVERNDGLILVEKAGYVSAKKRIESLMYSGERLQLARQNEYDFNGDDELEDRPEFITRYPDFDMLDAKRALSSIKPKVKVASPDPVVPDQPESEEN